MIEVLEVFVGFVAEIEFQRNACVDLQDALKSLEIFFGFVVDDQRLGLFNQFLGGDRQENLR